MHFEKLRHEVLAANLELVRRGLVLFTFGNASGIDRQSGVIAIKPSGVEYEQMEPGHIVITDLDGNVVDGDMKPSSDLATHLLLYKEFPGIGGVAHTHSEYATAWAQAGMEIPAYGTTHADYFHGPVPVTRELTSAQINGDYVHETGNAIVERFRKLDPMAMPGVLVAGHAPFAWGKDAAAAAYHAMVLEAVARIGFYTHTLRPETKGISQALLDRHYFRKHGEKATYGQ